MSRHDKESSSGVSRASRCCSTAETAKLPAPARATGTATGFIMLVYPRQQGDDAQQLAPDRRVHERGSASPDRGAWAAPHICTIH